MHFPTWVDLKGQDSVPETVHHVVNIICKNNFFCISSTAALCRRHEMFVIWASLIYPEATNLEMSFLATFDVALQITPARGIAIFSDYCRSLP